MKQWAVITGGGRGLGAALAIELARHGFHILCVDINLNPLQALIEKHPQCTEYIHTLQGDLTTPEGVDQISPSIPDEDHIKFFIPTQRVGFTESMEEISVADFEKSLKVLVVSPLMVYQKIVHRMKRCQSRILHTDTLIDYYPKYGAGGYSIGKTAYYKLGKQIQLELSDTSVRVGSCYPGLVNTEAVKGGLDERKKDNSEKVKGEDFIQFNKDNGTFFEPEESARFLAYLLLSTEDKEFEGTDWKANDKSQWYRWKNV